MAFFGLFGNKEKKNKEANNANKQNILSLIQTITMSCRNADALAVLNSIRTELQSQGETSDEKVLVIDAEVIQLLSEANTFVLKQQYPIAQTKLNKALSKAIDRHQYCMTGGQMTKQDKAAADAAKKLMAQATAGTKKSRSEELQAQIDEKNAELEALQQEFENLRKLHEENRSNASIMAQGNTVRMKITAVKTQIDNLTVELNKETTDTLVSDMANTNEQLTRGRTHSDSEMEVHRAKIQAQNEARDATKEQLAADFDLLGQTSGASLDPFAEGSAASDPFADVFGTASTQSQNQQFGNFNASEVGTVDMAREIAKAARALQESIDAYTDKIDDSNDELSDLNAELKPLLERRRTASPSDCLALDGQIDQVNAKRSSVVYRIKRYRQVVSQLNDKMSLLDKLSTQQDLAATNAKIEQLTDGKFSDFEGLAMFLNTSVRESNEQLEEIGMAIGVAESEEILMNSAAGASAALNDAGTTKDEEKYLAVEQELGMVR